MFPSMEESIERISQLLLYLPVQCKPKLTIPELTAIQKEKSSMTETELSPIFRVENSRSSLENQKHISKPDYYISKGSAAS